MKKATIKDVARLAGVSIATVSRALRGNYPVDAMTRDNVLSSAKALNYEVNRAAQSLKSFTSHMIGLIIADISNPYFMSIAKGLESVIEEKGYTLVCSSSEESMEREQKILKTFRQYHIDGVVLASCAKLSSPLRENFQESMPCVLINNRIPQAKADTVSEHEREAMAVLTGHLIDRGHRYISVINGSLDMLTGLERYHGFIDEMSRRGVAIRGEYIADGMFDMETAAARFTEILDGTASQLPTAVICASNLMMKGVLRVLCDRGISIPGEMSVCCYNEPEFFNIFSPRITHMTDNTREIGRKAGEILLRRLAGQRDEEPYQTIYLGKEFIDGESVRIIAP